MDQGNFRKLLRRTVALPVVLLLLLAAILVAEIFVVSASLRWVDHSDRVIASMRQDMRHVVEMDNSLRGYHQTGDQSFLTTYNDDKAQSLEQLDTIERLTRDNPEQQERLRKVRETQLRWSQMTEQLLALGTTKLSDAELWQDQQLMSAIRDSQRVFTSAEEALRDQRSRESKTLNDVLVGAAVGLVLLVAILLTTTTRHELMDLSENYERHLRAEVEQKQQLKQSREWFQITLKSLAEAVVATDERGRISFINPVAQQLTGWRDGSAESRPFAEVVRLKSERTRQPAEDPIDAVRRDEKVIAYGDALLLASRDGKEYPIELTGAPILQDSGHLAGVAVVFRDITQRRQTEQTLRANERLSLAGRLSATIAHEIRNPLDTVANLIYLLRNEQKPDPVSERYLTMASDELSRIAQITAHLLTFHREARSPVTVSLTDVLESVLVLFSPQIKRKHIVVEKRFDEVPGVRGFPGELRQVFSNLIGNAIEAMSGEGRLLVSIRKSSYAGQPETRGVRVTIVDNGSGIPANVRRNLFAAFFTTKGEKGTGLGLWISRGIVQKHEGTIHVYSSSRPGHSGTAFSVFLPFEQKLGFLDVNAEPVVA